MRSLRFLACIALLLSLAAQASTTFDGGVSLGSGESVPGNHRFRMIHVVCVSGSGGMFAIRANGESGPIILTEMAGASPSTMQFPMYGQTVPDLYVSTLPATCAVVAFINL